MTGEDAIAVCNVRTKRARAKEKLLQVITSYKTHVIAYFVLVVAYVLIALAGTTSLGARVPGLAYAMYVTIALTYCLLIYNTYLSHSVELRQCTP